MTSRLLYIIILSVMLSRLCAGQSISSYSQFEGLPVKEVIKPDWARSLTLPMKIGRPLRLQEIAESEAILRQYLETILPVYPFPVTLEAALYAAKVKRAGHNFLVSIFRGPGDYNMVTISFTIKRLALTEDDTPGRALDEASNWNPAYPVFEGTGGIQIDRRFGAGELGFALPRFSVPFGLSIRPTVEMWVQPIVNPPLLLLPLP